MLGGFSLGLPLGFFYLYRQWTLLDSKQCTSNVASSACPLDLSTAPWTSRQSLMSQCHRGDRCCLVGWLVCWQKGHLTSEPFRVHPVWPMTCQTLIHTHTHAMCFSHKHKLLTHTDLWNTLALTTKHKHTKMLCVWVVNKCVDTALFVCSLFHSTLHFPNICLRKLTQVCLLLLQSMRSSIALKLPAFIYVATWAHHHWVSMLSECTWSCLLKKAKSVFSS